MENYKNGISGFRYFVHICILVIAVIIGIVISIIYNLNLPREEILIFGPKDFKNSFDFALMDSDELSIFDYKIIFTDNKKEASIVVDYGKESDSSYIKCAYSPFIVGIGKSSKETDDLNIIKDSIYSEDEKDLKFEAIISAVNGELSWRDLGFPDNQIKVFYPNENTIYWHDFYNFMLINANNGSYPITLEQTKSSEEKVKEFLDSKYTISVENFKETTEIQGFNINNIYVFPELLFLKLPKEYNVKIFYPSNTYSLNFYLKSQNEIGKKLLNCILIDEVDYRSLKNPETSDDHTIEAPIGLRKNCNIVDIPKYYKTKNFD